MNTRHAGTRKASKDNRFHEGWNYALDEACASYWMRKYPNAKGKFLVARKEG